MISLCRQLLHWFFILFGQWLVILIPQLDYRMHIFMYNNKFLSLGFYKLGYPEFVSANLGVEPSDG